MVKYLFYLLFLLFLTACDSSSGGGVVGCPDNNHFEGNSCVANILSCSIKDGVGVRTWDGKKYSSCAITQCFNDKHPENGSCVDNERLCSTFYGQGKQVWDGEKYSECLMSSCVEGYHLVGQQCLYNVQECFVENGSGFKIWENGEYSACQINCNEGFHTNANQTVCENDIVSCTVPNGFGQKVWENSQYSECRNLVCNSNYVLFNNSCIPLSVTCNVDNGVGTKVWTGADYGECVLSTCNSGFHREGNVCESNTRSCPINNGAGSQIWNVGTNLWGSCQIVSCLNDYHIEAGQCQSDAKICSLPNGQGVQYWNNITKLYGSCLSQSCNNGFHVDGALCLPNTRNCFISNGQGLQTWNEQIGDWNTCEASICNSGYHIENGQCVYNTKSCLIANGLGTQSWISNQNQYGQCTPISCNSGFHANLNSCDPNQITCFVVNGEGSQTWNGSSYGQCTPTNCINNYHIENNSCIFNEKSCAIQNGVGVQYWDQINLSYSQCQIQSCNSDFHLESNQCLPNLKSCQVNNFVGSSYWIPDSQTYSTCAITGCVVGYHLDNGICQSDQIACSVSNGQGIKTWNGSSYSACSQIICNPSYFNYKDICIEYGQINSSIYSNQIIKSRIIKNNNNKYLYITANENLSTGSIDLTYGRWNVLDLNFNNLSYLNDVLPITGNYEKMINQIGSNVTYLADFSSTSLMKMDSLLNRTEISSNFEPLTSNSFYQDGFLYYYKKDNFPVIYRNNLIDSETIFKDNFPANSLLTNNYMGNNGNYLEITNLTEFSKFISLYKKTETGYSLIKNFTSPSEFILKYFETGLNSYFNVGNMSTRTLSFYQDVSNLLVPFNINFSHVYSLAFDETQILEFNNYVFMNGSGSSSNGNQIYRTDGTVPQILKKLPFADRFFYNFKIVGAGFYVFSRTGSDTELYYSNGELENLTLVKNLGQQQVKQVVNVNNKYLSFLSEDSQKAYIWISDGTEAGTISVLNSFNKTGARIETSDQFILMGLDNRIFKINSDTLPE